MPPPAESPLPPEVLAALDAGQNINAIKLLRTATGLGLKETKDLIDAHQRGEVVQVPLRAAAPTTGTHVPDSVRQALAEGNKIEAIRLLRDHEGLSLKDAKDRVDALEQAAPGMGLAPGEQPRGSGGMLAWIVAACVLAVAGFYLLQRAG